jgi:predicted nucleotide-binding protein (sugar kinase/HSP70/actin superfamily)
LLASLSLVDEVEQESLRLRPREQERGAATLLRIEALAAVRACQGRADLQSQHKAILEPLRIAPRDNGRRAFRVALLGDVYSISEPYFNMNLEQQLGYMGVEVERWFWLSRSLRLPILDRVRNRSETHAREEEVGRYLGHDVGGFALPSMKEAVAFVREGIDGLIHLAPFNCTPEIVAVSVLPRLARDYDVPLLALSFDEHSGKAGLVTRLEAFVDLLERRTRRRGPGPARRT